MVHQGGEDGDGDAEHMQAESQLDDEYEEYDDTKQVVDIPSNAPSTPPANLDPEMVRALEVFPQWTQEQIQEYFDMGWNVETLLEWVNEQ